MRRKVEHKWVMFSNVSSLQCFKAADLVAEVGCEKKGARIDIRTGLEIS